MMAAGMKWSLLKCGRPAVILIGLTVGLASGVFYARLIEQFRLRSFSADDRFFGADSLQASEAIRAVKSDRDRRKHPLFSPVMYQVNRGVGALSGRSGEDAVVLTLAGVAGLNFVLAFGVLASRNRPVGEALLFTAVYASCFANIILFAVPETYSFANLAVLLVCWRVRAYARRPNTAAVIGLGVTSGMAGLANLPLLSLSLPAAIAFVPIHGVGGALRRGLLVVALATALVIAGNVALFGEDFYRFLGHYGERYGSVLNLTSTDRVWETFTAFFFYAVVRGVAYFDGRLTMSGVGSLALRSWPAMLLTATYVLFLARAVTLAVVRRRATPLAWLAWILVMLGFYAWFNPAEAMLYTTQCLFPLLYIVAHDFNPGRSRPWLLGLAVFLGLLQWHNFAILEWR